MHVYLHMKVQKAHLPQPIANLGETIPVPAQAHLFGRVAWVPSLEN